MLWILSFPGFAPGGITFLLASRRKKRVGRKPASPEEKQHLARLLGFDVKKM
jgi:hypothetical protein